MRKGKQLVLLREDNMLLQVVVVKDIRLGAHRQITRGVHIHQLGEVLCVLFSDNFRLIGRLPSLLLDFANTALYLLRHSEHIFLGYLLEQLLATLLLDVNVDVLSEVLHVGDECSDDGVQFSVFSEIPPADDGLSAEGTVGRFVNPPILFSTLLAEDMPAVPHPAGLVKDLEADWAFNELQNTLDGLFAE
jgi:hypothetical protein